MQTGLWAAAALTLAGAIAAFTMLPKKGDVPTTVPIDPVREPSSDHLSVGVPSSPPATPVLVDAARPS